MPDLDTTLAILATTPATLGALLRHLPAELLNTPESPNTWTATEVVAHLIHGERTDWLPRVKILLRAGETETFPTFQREAHRSTTTPPLSDLLADLARLRAESLAELSALQLTPADLDRTGRHPAFGVITLSQLLSTWAAHDLTHLHQLSRILAAPFTEAVGPWERYLGVLHCNGHSASS
jgi:hypothetical protein